MSKVIGAIENEFTVVTADLVLEAVIVVVLPDIAIRRLTLRALRAEVVS